jgi:hypothetical protein
MSTFTVGVFQDVEWARRGLAALMAAGFAPETISVVGKETPDVQQLIDEQLPGGVRRLQLKSVGAAVGAGRLIAELDGTDEALSTSGLAGTFRRAGFQSHDGFIYEKLTERGGVLVAVEEDRRAADALAKLHAYGAGNAAIGAWKGRL